MDLQTRVVNILTKPGEEWPVIAGETTDAATLIKGYVAILAAIPAIGTFIGTVVVGVGMGFLGTFRVAARARRRDDDRQLRAVDRRRVPRLDRHRQARADVPVRRRIAIQALKLVVYASTPTWLAGVLNIIPALGLLGILAGLYGIYLFYLGVTPLMKTPSGQGHPLHGGLGGRRDRRDGRSSGCAPTASGGGVLIGAGPGRAANPARPWLACRGSHVVSGFSRTALRRC